MGVAGVERGGLISDHRSRLEQSKSYPYPPRCCRLQVVRAYSGVVGRLDLLQQDSQAVQGFH